MTDTFTNRRVEATAVRSVEPAGDRGAFVTAETGWTALAPPQVAAALSVGTEYELETQNLSTVTGWRVNGVWLARKSDQQLDREHAEMVAGFERQREDQLATMRDEWTRRSAELPGWVRERLDGFRRRGGARFETDGWGYELVVCELAAMYAADGLADTERINAYADREGTSGNQHDCAKALARRHLAGESLVGTVSALTPLTGDPFFEGAR